MHEVIGECPVCHDQLQVTKLACPTCETSIKGKFTLGKFYHLTQEQMAFIEAFLRCGGVIKRVEDMLGLSYPAVRARLDDIIQTLGFPPEREPSLSTERRREILAELSDGKIDTEEAMQLLGGRGAEKGDS